ncbi:LOW QUALITY PROTEIN: hypothetical protein GQ55_8G195600 [Panicum hallii var. hallii]|uniref:Uncharacterized protein n=1 Tax=Panicum hallii var. hallii TaxID=1504633 RepID=A0A2T7CP68_9POAL|nr:LOW QUALITY PROTEIN: hypothetical protein GQ55_8G195600 [Panicum hallii var. hallii]
MEKKLDGAEPVGMKEKWKRHSIFRVPHRFKAVHGNVFAPQTVALGPFHHHDAALRPWRSTSSGPSGACSAGDRPLRELAAAVGDMAEELEDAYAGLGAEWRGGNRGRFLEMMVADGCFLLEVMRRQFEDYDPDDPVFGEHAGKHIAAFVQRDMLMIENQLPLALLRRIVAVESGELPDERSINNIVAEFLCEDGWCATEVGSRLGLHPLDVYRRSLLWPWPSPSRQEGQRTYCCFPTIGGAARASQQHYSSCCLPTRSETGAAPPSPRSRGATTAASASRPPPPPPRSAKRLWEAGIRFRRSETRRLDDIRFDMCTRRLRMPRIVLDDSTECKFSNLMAFEALHAGAGSGGVTAFVLFLRDMVDSAGDVAALREGGVLDHDLAGSDWAVVRLVNRLSRDVAKIGDSDLCRVRREVEDYCNGDKWRLKGTYLSSPWAFIALVVTIWLVGTDMTQTLYAVKTYEREHGGNATKSP